MPKEPFLESSVMEILWSADHALTPAEVRVELAPNNPVAYTTVLTVVSRLWKKGLLAREGQGRTYTYAPVEEKEEATARRMEELLASTGERGLTLARFLETLSHSDRVALRRLLP